MLGACDSFHLSTLIGKHHSFRKTATLQQLKMAGKTSDGMEYSRKYILFMQKIYDFQYEIHVNNIQSRSQVKCALCGKLMLLKSISSHLKRNTCPKTLELTPVERDLLFQQYVQGKVYTGTSSRSHELSWEEKVASNIDSITGYKKENRKLYWNIQYTDGTCGWVENQILECSQVGRRYARKGFRLRNQGKLNQVCNVVDFEQDWSHPAETEITPPTITPQIQKKERRRRKVKRLSNNRHRKLELQKQLVASGRRNHRSPPNSSPLQIQEEDIAPLPSSESEEHDEVSSPVTPSTPNPVASISSPSCSL